jgi:hypothetical protein
MITGVRVASPGPHGGALTRLPTSPGETLGQDMEDSFQVTCPHCGETVELFRRKFATGKVE